MTEYKVNEDFMVRELGDMMELSASNLTRFIAGVHWAGRNSYHLDWETFTVMYNQHSINLYKKKPGGVAPKKKESTKKK